jgi:hypothetical protein
VKEGSTSMVAHDREVTAAPLAPESHQNPIRNPQDLFDSGLKCMAKWGRISLG